jgi:lipoate---protein ligase
VPLRLIDAGEVSGLRSQTIYHAVAHSFGSDSPDTVILVSPVDPYVCIGFHQDLDREIDLEYCATNGISVVRRELGGGAVYIDRHQAFVQWVFHSDSLPRRIDARFEMFSRPIVTTYSEIGIDAHFSPINDILVNGRKICGTGAGTIGEAEVVVGNFLFDFDTTRMSRLLRLSSEEYREKVLDGLNAYMTTVRQEVENVPTRTEMKEIYIRQCEKVLGDSIVEGSLTVQELEEMERLDDLFRTDEWLFQEGGMNRRGVKIHSGVWVYETTGRSDQDEVRATLRLTNGKIDDISFSGDFSLSPQTRIVDLETALIGSVISHENVSTIVDNFFEREQIAGSSLDSRILVDAILQVNDFGRSG